MGNSQQVFQSIFKRSMFENDTKDFLTGIVKEYPYFTAAQFYLLQKNDTGSDEYNKQLATTAILFNNPFWLNYQLEQSFGSAALPEQTFADGINDNEVSYNTVSYEPGAIYPSQGITETILVEEKIETPEQHLKDETTFETIPEPVEDNLLPASFITEISDFHESNNVSKQEDIKITGEKITEEIAESTEAVLATEIQDIPEMDADTNEKKADETVQDTITEPSAENILPTETKETSENEEEAIEDIPEKEIEPLNFKLNFTNATTTTDDTISFEPLYTSDYFASLGIKFSDEIKPDDKLGKHLKSFTEWLKTMKKIHPDQLPQQTEQSEIIIKQMAEKSNTEGEILTEAMAEVLLQQGKLGKAIEVYQKLSLLNPLKSAYFAAKIDKIER